VFVIQQPARDRVQFEGNVLRYDTGSEHFCRPQIDEQCYILLLNDDTNMTFTQVLHTVVLFHSSDICCFLLFVVNLGLLCSIAKCRATRGDPLIIIPVERWRRYRHSDSSPFRLDSDWKGGIERDSSDIL
jgi:hypothetical protein